jgi:hypothetical protein
VSCGKPFDFTILPLPNATGRDALDLRDPLCVRSGAVRAEKDKAIFR